jgi:hypothetical protein
MSDLQRTLLLNDVVYRFGFLQPHMPSFEPLGDALFAAANGDVAHAYSIADEVERVRPRSAIGVYAARALKAYLRAA